MAYLRKNSTLIFTSSREVITYYTDLIEQLAPQLQGITIDEYQAIRAEISDLRKELVNQLKNFDHRQVDVYFTDAMASAESELELYALSNAYEALLIGELRRIKKKLHLLRTT